MGSDAYGWSTIFRSPAVLFFILLSSLASAGEVSIEKTNFRGWNGAWKVSNKSSEFIIVPQITRVMYFGLKDGENVLFVDPDLAGTLAADDGKWHNFGGDKVWPTEEDLWEKYTGRKYWVPPFSFDGAPVTAEAIDCGVRLIQPSAAFGTLCVREFTLDPELPLVRIHQSYQKTAGDPAKMTIWNVTQIRKPLLAMLPLEAGLRYIEIRKLVPALSGVRDTVVVLKNDVKTDQKAGVPVDAELKEGWAAAVYENLLIVESHILEKDETYPRGGCHAQVYMANKASRSYAELELLGPFRELKAGENMTHDIVWQIVPGKFSDDVAKAAAVAREAHRFALQRLNAK